MNSLQLHPDTTTPLRILHRGLNILQAVFKIIQVLHMEVVIQVVHMVVGLPIPVVHTVVVVAPV